MYTVYGISIVGVLGVITRGEQTDGVLVSRFSSMFCFLQSIPLNSLVCYEWRSLVIKIPYNSTNAECHLSFLTYLSECVCDVPQEFFCVEHTGVHHQFPACFCQRPFDLRYRTAEHQQHQGRAEVWQKKKRKIIYLKKQISSNPFCDQTIKLNNTHRAWGASQRNIDWKSFDPTQAALMDFIPKVMLGFSSWGSSMFKCKLKENCQNDFIVPPSSNASTGGWNCN